MEKMRREPILVINAIIKTPWISIDIVARRRGEVRA
jgi:hypothetical protein